MLSRVADNLYWMSRYIERAQHTARLLDATLGLMLDQSPELARERWQRTLHSLGQHKTLDAADWDMHSVAHRLTFDASESTSIFSCVRSARENARQVREEISGEMWECLNRLYLRVRSARPPLSADGTERSESTFTFWRQPHEFFAGVQRSAFEFDGATNATMRHSEGWLFIQAGRGLEQAAKTASLLDANFCRDEANMQTAGNEGSLKWSDLLRSCAALEPYCRAHSPRLVPERIEYFLMLDNEFPRSVRASVRCVDESLADIARCTGKVSSAAPSFDDGASHRRLQRLSGQLRAQLDHSSLEDIIDNGLPEFLKNTQEQFVRIHYGIYAAYIGYMAE
jgi:uncharacterized alpha-E superfamily protein